MRTMTRGDSDMLTEAETSAWRNLLTAHDRVLGRLDGDLLRDADISLAEYEVLQHLVESPDMRLRMNELAELARLSPSGLTRRFDALVRRGWVVRERCDDDRRGVYASITPDGEERMRFAEPIYVRGVHRYFFDMLGDDHLNEVNDVMAMIADANSNDIDR